ncbi:hypothetical protein LguiA_000748 [Lonicera macranthoides]
MADVLINMKKQPMFLSLLIRSIILAFCFAHAVAELERFEHPPKADGSLSTLVIGDWGRRGTHNQSQVALQMGIIGEKVDVDFIISTGDNFYDSGLTDVNDPAFDESFTQIYTAQSLQKQWYSVLGNHDYRGNAMAQLSPILTHRDTRWLCLRSFIVNSEMADFFFIDTTPFQEKYFTNPEDHTYDWREILPRKHYLSNLLRDVDLALRESGAKWKIVVGHHTIRSIGLHGDTIELVAQLLPILEANDVDLYINGHDHCLEHISSTDSPLQFLTSGGGSKAWRGERNTDESIFYYDGQGFMSLEIGENGIDIKFYDIGGNVIHKWSRDKSFYSFM